VAGRISSGMPSSQRVGPTAERFADCAERVSSAGR